MTHVRHGFLSLALLVPLCACQFHARSPEHYREDTRKVLETRTPEIQACYAEALDVNPLAAGRVAVRMVVSAKTGVITTARVLPESTAPVPVADCVRLALYGLTLEPPDAQEGDATFVWTFARR